MKKITSIIGLLLLSGNCFAITAKWTSSVSYGSRGSTYNFTVEYERTDEDKEKGRVKEVKYEWTINGNAFRSSDSSPESSTATVRMANPTAMSDDRSKWDTGLVACTVTVTFSRGAEESASVSQDVTLVP